MINALFRTNFESNTPSLLVFGVLHVLLAFVMIQSGVDSHAGMPRPVPYKLIALWLSLFGLMAAGLSLLRHNRERRGRLYAQLPVTALQVRLAYWCQVAFFLGISTLMLVLIMLLLDDLSLLQVLLYAALFLCHGVVVMAVLSIAGSNTVRLIPEEVRRRTIVYFFMATLLTFVFMILIGYTVSWYVYLMNGGTVNWGLATLTMALLGAGLVLWDLQLFRNRENYLG